MLYRVTFTDTIWGEDASALPECAANPTHLLLFNAAANRKWPDNVLSVTAVSIAPDESPFAMSPDGQRRRHLFCIELLVSAEDLITVQSFPAPEALLNDARSLLQLDVEADEEWQLEAVVQFDEDDPTPSPWDEGPG
jgi:hypothetical protein